MPNPLDLPDELLSLIEKRDQDDRRAASEALPTDPAAAQPIVVERRHNARRADDCDDGRGK
jgi:hypothetical protein